MRLIQDLRFGGRMFLKNPGYAASIGRHWRSESLRSRRTVLNLAGQSGRHGHVDEARNVIHVQLLHHRLTIAAHGFHSEVSITAISLLALPSTINPST